jgi:hypothetical protein
MQNLKSLVFQPYWGKPNVRLEVEGGGHDVNYFAIQAMSNQ